MIYFRLLWVGKSIFWEIEKFVFDKTPGLVEFDLGTEPMRASAVLIFPGNTNIYIRGDAMKEERQTQPDEEFLVRKWCNGEGMTWGFLALPEETYFKALANPLEARELKIIGNEK